MSIGRKSDYLTATAGRAGLQVNAKTGVSFLIKAHPVKEGVMQTYSSLKEVDLSNLAEEDMDKIMGLPLVRLQSLAKDHEEFVRIVRLAINRGIDMGRSKTLLVYNQALRGRS